MEGKFCGMIAGNNLSFIQHTKSMLHHHFCIKDLSTLKYFMGLEIARTSSEINICQHKYTLDLLAKTGLLGCKPATTPMAQDTRLQTIYGTPLQDKTKFHRLIGHSSKSFIHDLILLILYDILANTLASPLAFITMKLYAFFATSKVPQDKDSYFPANHLSSSRLFQIQIGSPSLKLENPSPASTYILEIL